MNSDKPRDWDNEPVTDPITDPPEMPEPIAPPFSPVDCPILVIKIGSSLLVNPDGTVRRAWLESLIADIAYRVAAGQKIIIVASGSIALGARRLGFSKGGRATLADAQASASVGQIALAGLWAELLGEHGLTAAQMLLTLDDLEDRRRYLNATATLNRLVEANAIPIINENDSVATGGIRFGDNDRLAARIAQASEASGVLLLTDIDGLYDRNPAEDGAQFIPEVNELTEDIHAMADNKSKSGMGTGGMGVKLEAARMASLAGIKLAIINGSHDRPLAIYEAHQRGTIFWPQRSENARKSWLGGRFTAHGKLHIDAGAVTALYEGKSLLAAGVTRIEDNFQRGNVVDIVGPDGVTLARGLTEYTAIEAEKIIGKRSEEIEAILGHAPRSALVHRDQLVLL